jgi:hypothetical protein
MALLPLLLALGAFLVLLTVILVGGVQLPPAAAPALTKVKAAPTASTPEACRVAMLSNALVVFGCSLPSLWDKAWHIVPSQKVKMTPVLATQGVRDLYVKNTGCNQRGARPTSTGSPLGPRVARAHVCVLKTTGVDLP